MNAANGAAGAFVVIAEFEVKEEKLDAFLALAAYDSERSRADEPGCLQFDVTVLEGTPKCVLFYEVYESRAAFDHHLTTPHLERFRNEFPALVAREKPVRFATRAAP
jgi:quinol monooxygenase YgiN